MASFIGNTAVCSLLVLGVAGSPAELGHEGGVKLVGAEPLLRPGGAVLAGALVLLALKLLGIGGIEHNTVGTLLTLSGLLVRLLDSRGGLLGGLLMSLLGLLVGLLGLLGGLLTLGRLLGLLGGLLGLLGGLLGLLGLLHSLLSGLGLGDRLLGNLGILLDALGLGLALLRCLVELDGLGLLRLVLASSDLHDVLRVHLVRLRQLKCLLLLFEKRFRSLQLLFETCDDVHLGLHIEDLLVNSELVLVEAGDICLEHTSQSGGAVHGLSDLVVLLHLPLLLRALLHEACHDRETAILDTFELVAGFGSMCRGHLGVCFTSELFCVASSGGNFRHRIIVRSEHHMIMILHGINLLFVHCISITLDKRLIHGLDVIELLFWDNFVDIAGKGSSHTEDNHHRGEERHDHLRAPC